MAVPNIELNSGYVMPMVGLGTWKSAKGEVRKAVEAGISVGIRHVDCAAVYGNEQEIGQALEAKIKDGTVKREDLFITSKVEADFDLFFRASMVNMKLWNTKHHPDDVKPALQKTLSDLRLSYLDMYLMHWPIASKAGDELFPKDANGLALFDDVDLMDTWKAMEACVDEGLVKSIGMSNFNESQLQYILDNASIKPSNVQLENHPFIDQTELMDFCKKNDIAITAFSPFASPDRPHAKPTDPRVFENETILKIAASTGKSPAQVVLRYQVQRGSAVIPKSLSQERMKQNMQLFDFELSKADMDAILGLNINFRACPGSAWKNYPELPWKLESEAPCWDPKA